MPEAVARGNRDPRRHASALRLLNFQGKVGAYVLQKKSRASSASLVVSESPYGAGVKAGQSERLLEANPSESPSPRSTMNAPLSS